MKDFISVLKFDKKDIDEYILLISAPILLTIYWYYGNADFISNFLPANLTDIQSGFFSYIGQFFSFFILLFVIPVIYIKSFKKRSLKDFGLHFGNSRFGLKLVLLIVPFIIVPVIYLAAQMGDIQKEYPLLKLLHTNKEWLLYYELAYVILYYFAWEFYFRGFLLFGLSKKFGPLNAVLIQTISSCLIHLGKPDGEIFGSIVVGVIFGAIALRTNSFIYVFVLHAAIGVLTDLFIIY
ncbi:MAG: CPBP family intramembrane metalloprotease [Calditrichaeota bacterium]|nr:MAG: CPBP family intramembrane metalloprotease [Calditrichota bacterium]MBL1206748.1 CPBP family intramembrane metalloprotease [Calditrichota bacterium]NOG46574.1 CPBP family intramembrane metalloprotease [Calditrichota bacterium]